MEFSIVVKKLKKRYPFTISRGTRTHSDNVFLFLHDGPHIGIGEFDPGSGPEEEIKAQCLSLEKFLTSHDVENIPIHEVWQKAHEFALPKPAQAALDMALWDLFGKRCQQPCYKLFGLDSHSGPTSITLGILPSEQCPERVQELLRGDRFRSLKIKLGSPLGIKQDQEAFRVIKDAALPFRVSLRVDANGGWSLADAKIMCDWLASFGVEYVEQPLSVNDDHHLPELFTNRPLPIFVDESCRLSADIPRLASYVDGINIKLMKCGGLTEALRMVAVARAHALKTMIGCMSESSIAISASASIASLFDYIDLDSALNLDPDPALGAALIDGRLIPLNFPGHGAALC